TLPKSMESGLVAQGLPQAVANQVANLPPVASLFAAFLGYNPMGQLIPPAALHALTAAQQATITGKEFFPSLLAGPFMVGIKIAFTISVVLYVLAAIASWLGGRPSAKRIPRKPISRSKPSSRVCRRRNRTYRGTSLGALRCVIPVQARGSLFHP